MSDETPVTSRAPRPDDPKPLDLRDLVLLAQDLTFAASYLDRMPRLREPAPIVVPFDPPSLSVHLQARPFVSLPLAISREPVHLGIDWASEPRAWSKGMRRHIRRLKAAGLPVPERRRGLPRERTWRRRVLRDMREGTDRAYFGSPAPDRTRRSTRVERLRAHKIMRTEIERMFAFARGLGR